MSQFEELKKELESLYFQYQEKEEIILLSLRLNLSLEERNFSSIYESPAMKDLSSWYKENYNKILSQFGWTQVEYYKAYRREYETKIGITPIKTLLDNMDLLQLEKMIQLLHELFIYHPSPINIVTCKIQNDLFWYAQELHKDISGRSYIPHTNSIFYNTLKDRYCSVCNKNLVYYPLDYRLFCIDCQTFL